MKAYERIYREILIKALEKKERFTQLGLSKECNVSLGLVNKTIKKLAEIGAIQIMPMGFSIIDTSRILFGWAAKRNMKKDIKEAYSIDMPVFEIEKELPFILTAYSAWRLLTQSVPFDYSEVYVYVQKNEENLFRLWLKDKPLAEEPKNLFVIFTNDLHLIKNSKKKIVPVPQIFVDIYGLAGMAPKYFLTEIMEKYPIFKFEIEK